MSAVAPSVTRGDIPRSQTPHNEHVTTHRGAQWSTTFADLQEKRLLCNQISNLQRIKSSCQDTYRHIDKSDAGSHVVIWVNFVHERVLSPIREHHSLHNHQSAMV